MLILFSSKYKRITTSTYCIMTITTVLPHTLTWVCFWSVVFL